MKIRHIISAISLTAGVVSLYWLLQTPRRIAPPQTPATMAANAQSFQHKLEQLERDRAQGSSNSEIRLNSEEVNAALAQATGTIPAASANHAAPLATSAPVAQNAGADEQPTVKNYQVSLDGDVVKGQFVAQMAGKDIYVTVAGHLGAKDGYATFEPTEFKVGEMSIPVSLVNEALQKKLAEQRDQLRLPDYIGDVRVENGELVIKEK